MDFSLMDIGGPWKISNKRCDFCCCEDGGWSRNKQRSRERTLKALMIFPYPDTGSWQWFCWAQRFAGRSVHQNSLEGLLKHRLMPLPLLASTSCLIQCFWDGAQELPSTFPDDPDADSPVDKDKSGKNNTDKRGTIQNVFYSGSGRTCQWIEFREEKKRGTNP